MDDDGSKFDNSNEILIRDFDELELICSDLRMIRPRYDPQMSSEDEKNKNLESLYSWTSVIWPSVIRISLLSGHDLAVYMYMIYFQLKSCSRQKQSG